MLAAIAERLAATAWRTGVGALAPQIAAAMLHVPRERFAAGASVQRAHDDTALPIGDGQTLSQPFVVALMTTLLQPAPRQRILEIGTGSGYQAAVLAELVAEVRSVEVVPRLAERAAALLHELGDDHVFVRIGDGWQGWPEHAPYDGIIVTCGASAISPALLAQLSPDGHLVMPLGPPDAQQLCDITLDGQRRPLVREVLSVRFVPFVHD